jgi:hypothetical protein
LQGIPCQRRHYAKKQHACHAKGDIVRRSNISDYPPTTTMFLIHNSPEFFKLMSRAFYKTHKDSSIYGANGSNRYAPTRRRQRTKTLP